MIKITDIANTLADRHELALPDAQAFVTELFSLIGDGLRSDDRQVKVKGLGTFKVTSVSARESVDVNTGERIVIEGREKIVFTPDAVLRDRVNRPFAQFETVTLRDDVNFSEIDKAFEQGVPKITETPQKPEEPQASEPAEETMVTEPAAPVIVEQPTEVEHPTEEVHSEPKVKEAEPTIEGETPAEEKEAVVNPTTEIKETTSVAVEEEKPTVEESVASQSLKNRLAEKQMENTATAESQPTEPDEPSNNDDNHDEEYDDEPHRNTLAIWLTAIIIVLLIAGGASGGYLWHELSVRNDSIAVLQTRLIDIEEHIHQAKATASTAKDTVTTSAPADTTTKTKAKEATASSQPETPATDYNQDVRIRTGAYKIVGIDKTVTVKAGQTLTSIANTYLGSGMECYVEAVNGKREYKVGESIKLPKLELKKAAKKKQ